jgi:3-deoxy-manno-octulosonate cytidylyltransferase (CMP-KDO synthetase)
MMALYHLKQNRYKFAQKIIMIIVGIIPARYASTRFPGKPLAMIHGKTMIQRVYEQATKALEHVVVATDDERIATAVANFGGHCVMTAEHHQSGTDRCVEALLKYEQLKGITAHVAINIQGDEPFIDPGQITQLATLFNESGTQLATLIKPIDNTDTLFSPNRVKVVTDAQNNALYFSRQAIPFIRGAETGQWLNQRTFYVHIGMYGYLRQALLQITQLPQSSLEVAESLEQLRWIENGYPIKTAITHVEALAIDTPDDLEKVISITRP